MPGNHEAKDLGYPPGLTRRKAVAHMLKHQVNSGVDYEKVFLLASSYRCNALQPVRVGLVEKSNAAEAGEGKDHADEVEVLRVRRVSEALDPSTQCEEQRRCRQEPQVNAARVAVEPFKKAHPEKSYQAQQSPHHGHDEREYKRPCKGAEPEIDRERQ